MGGDRDRLGAAAAEWSGTRRIEIGPWSVRYRMAGSGQPVVLVHGLGVSADYWYRMGPPIAAAECLVVAPDLPGFGRTAGPDGGLGVLEQAEFMADFVREMGMVSAVYVGHSLSCQVVLELAARRPELVGGLVLVAPTGDPREGRLLRQGRGLALDIFREPWRLAAAVARAYLQAGPVRVWHTWRKGGRQNPMPLLPQISVRTAVVVGTRDPVVPEGFARRVAETLPHGEFRLVHGGAHGIVFSHAEEVSRAVVRIARAAARDHAPAGEDGPSLPSG